MILLMHGATVKIDKYFFLSLLPFFHKLLFKDSTDTLLTFCYYVQFQPQTDALRHVDRH